MAAFLVYGLLLTLVAGAFAVANINCNDGNFYIRPDPESCSHFYKCDNGKPVRFSCPSGLYYNPSSHVCDWPYNVNCENSGQNDGNNGQQQYDGNNGNSGQYNKNNGQQQYDGSNGNSGQYNGANGGQQYNGNNGNSGQYNENNGGQKYNGNNGQGPNNGNSGQGQDNGQDEYDDGYQWQDENSQDYNDDSIYYPVQNPPTYPQDTSVGPSVQEPPGPQDRPRPTYDQVFSANQHPYQAYLNQNNDSDIRK